MSLNKKFGSWGILGLGQQFSSVTKSKVFFPLAHLVSSVYWLPPQACPS